MFGNTNSNRNTRYSDTLVNRRTNTDESKRNGENGPAFKLKGPIRSVKVAQNDFHLNNGFSPSPDSISTSDLIGRYRFKYFASPVNGKSRSGSTLGTLEFSFPVPQVEVKSSEPFRSEVIPPTRTRGTQTDYRDSECQTDPYSPPYFVNDGIQDPEILLLRNLTWGNGLPAGKMEVEMIERARDRLNGKANVEGVADNIQDTKKWNQLFQTTGTAIETWLYEEQCQERLRDNKLQMLAKSLEDLRDRHGNLIQERLRTLWKRRYQEKEVKMAKMEAQKSREFRRLAGRKSFGDEFASITAFSDNNNNNDQEDCFDQIKLSPMKAGFEVDKRKSSNTGYSSFNSTSSQRSRSPQCTDLAGLDRILPRVILSKGESDLDCLRGGSVLSISKPTGRRNKLERELEDAYLRILEKKRLSSNGFRKHTRSISPDKTVSVNEDAGTQTELQERNKSELNDENENVTSSQYEEQLNVILKELLSHHWTELTAFFGELLPGKSSECHT